jgi:hypothetical protein
VTDAPHGWTDPNPRDVTDPRAKTTLAIAAITLTTLVIAALVTVVVVKRSGIFGAGSPEETVVLTAANAPTRDSFMPSVAVGAPSDRSGFGTSSVAQQLSVSADRGVRLVAGTQPGLYGAFGQSNSCDAAAVANYLDAHPDVAKAWGQTIGISAAQIPYYLNTLTPVYLTADTWVTSNAYSDGRAAPFQTVLQAGNAVMIDPVGVPRVHCASGNPLLPPVNRNLSKLTRVEGKPWSGYDTQNVVAVAYYVASGAVTPQIDPRVLQPPQPKPALDEFSLRDLTTAEQVVRKAGGTINLGSGQAVALPDPLSMNRPPAAASHE